MRIALEFFAFLGELLLLVADLHFLELGEVAQFGFENCLGLDLAELEALHEHGLGLVLATDDADHFVEIEVRRQQAIEDVQSLVDLVEPELQPARDGGGAECEPLVEQVAQAQHLGLALERDHVDVHAIVALEIRGREQVRHELRHVGALLRLDDDADPFLVIRLVADVFDHRQLLLAHLRGDLLDESCCPIPGTATRR